MIRLLQIDYFLEVAEQMSITAAAKKLYISQPALSKQISGMEQDLGTKLFERNNRKITLTPAGEQLRNELKDVRKRLDKALENAAKVGQNSIQPMRLGCFDGRVTDDYLPGIIRKIYDYNPELPTQIFMDNMDDVLWKLREGKTDIAFTLEADYIPEPGYIYQRIFRRRSAIIYSDKLFEDNKGEVKVSDFKDKMLLLPKILKGHKLGKHNINRAIELGLKADRFMENENMSTTMMNLRLGIGYTFLSADIVEQGNGLKALELDEQYDAWIIAIVKADNVRALEIVNEVLAIN